MLLRLAYLAVTNTFAALRLLPMGDRDKDVEILALRHQITILERQLGVGARARFAPEDRAFLAALLTPPPRDVLRRLRLLIRPDTVMRCYAAADRGGAALALRRAQFERDRCLAIYQALQATASPDRRLELRVWALELLRHDARTARSGLTGWWPPSVLVDVLLWENSAEEAWQAAQEFGAVDQQWLRLARLRAETHPAEAIPVYERLAESEISLMKNDAYAEAADLAAQIIRLYDRLGQGADGHAYLERLRTVHKRKRNFMAELQRRGL
ncbi:hypothetical protein Acor_65410 [Acrocarpospora corrugata]|uniref:Uncharacterized protein n=1 Tax=Acrocarpospora corrugata TaxID=35763 RepID=A0A5M3WBD5_9ACTN|nr:hypothetical protein [Acrocarpospora corrugata]GES04473.1 hypothetical protein Acor_65410 [Acrocarpospora corrugata]